MALVLCRECGGAVADSAKSCPHCGVSSPAGACTLVVERKMKLGGAALPVTLYLDGVPQGKMRPGNSAAFEVQSGQHVIDAEVPGRGSFTATFSLSAGESIGCEVTTSGFSGAPKIRLV